MEVRTRDAKRSASWNRLFPEHLHRTEAVNTESPLSSLIVEVGWGVCVCGVGGATLRVPSLVL